MDKNTMIRIMQEEQEKLIVEIKERINEKKKYMNADKPETGFQNLLKRQ